jgi:hypothetical protein
MKYSRDWIGFREKSRRCDADEWRMGRIALRRRIAKHAFTSILGTSSTVADQCDGQTPGGVSRIASHRVLLRESIIAGCGGRT